MSIFMSKQEKFDYLYLYTDIYSIFSKASCNTIEHFLVSINSLLLISSKHSSLLIRDWLVPAEKTHELGNSWIRRQDKSNKAF